MNDVPNQEAIALLGRPLVCEDPPGWTHNALRPGLATMECGLINEDGSRSGLQVWLQVGRSSKTKVRTFKFSVFRARLGAMDRVYQLHISAVSHRPQNWHDMAHEHVGDERVDGSTDWLQWDFQRALDYFCQRANITFKPPMEDPEAFQLQP